MADVNKSIAMNTIHLMKLADVIGEVVQPSITLIKMEHASRRAVVSTSI